MANIKKVLVSGATFDVEALHFIDGVLDTPAQWKAYIDSIASKNLHTKIYTTLPTLSTATDEQFAIYKSEIALVASGAVAGSYVEYIVVGDNKATATWEKIGTTETDLTDYVKTGSRTTDGPSTDATGSAGEQSAVVTISGIKYDKANSATGSAGAHTHTVTGKVTAAGTISTGTGTANYTPAGSVSQPTFSDGSAASAGGHSHSVTAAGTISAAASTTGNYTPEGSLTGTQSISAHSHTVNVAKSTTGVITAQGTFTPASHGADTFTPNVPTKIDTSKFSGGSLNAAASKTVVTGVTAATLGATTTASTLAVKYVEGISSTGASASGTTAVVTGYGSFNGGNLSLTFPTMSGASNPTISATYKYAGNKSANGVMYGATVTNGVLSWTQDLNIGDLGFNAGSHGSVSGGTYTFTKASLGSASTASVVTGVTGGTASATTKYLTVSGGTAAGTTSVVPSYTLTPAAFTTGFYTAGSAASFTSGSFSGGSLSAASATTITYVTGATTSGNGSATVDFTKATFAGTKVQLSFAGSAVNTDSKGAHTHTVTGTVSKPTFTGTGVQLVFTGSTVDLASGSAAEAGAHTHSVTTTSTSVTGSATAAVSNHTHTLSNHTHSIDLQHTA